MRAIRLTEEGLRVAHRVLEKRDQQEMPLRLTEWGVSFDSWTVGNDLLLVLGGFTDRGEIQASSLAYEDVFHAVRGALEPNGWFPSILRQSFDHLVVAGLLCVEGGPNVDTMIAPLQEVCSALSNTLRIRILLIWREDPHVGRNIERILKHLKLPDSRLESTRRHLSILESAGLLSSRMHNRHKEYRMNTTAVASIATLLRSMFPTSYTE